MSRHAMLFLALVGCGGGAASAPAPAPAVPPTTTPTAQGVTVDHTVQTLDGKTVSLTEYRGKTLLIVNTASECGFTPQYKGLEALYEKYKDRGFVVLGFPSNDFGGQEPGDADQIASFCQKNYGVTFPLFAKVHAKQPDIAPIYKTLSEDTPEGIRGPVRWNFTKFLVDPKGQVIARFEPNIEPLAPEVTATVEKNLPAL